MVLFQGLWLDGKQYWLFFGAVSWPTLALKFACLFTLFCFVSSLKFFKKNFYHIQLNFDITDRAPTGI